MHIQEASSCSECPTFGSMIEESLFPFYKFFTKNVPYFPPSLSIFSTTSLLYGHFNRLTAQIDQIASLAMLTFISAFTFLALLHLMASLPLATSALSTSAGHGCWVFDASECNAFCKEYFEKPGHCGGFFYQTCYCE